MFADATLRQAAGYSYAREVTTRRGAQDLAYRMFAIAAIELYCEAFPEQTPTLRWLLRPRTRHTLLSELGRVARPRSDGSGELRWSDRDVSRMIQIAQEIAGARPTTKAGVARIRELRRQSS